LEVNQGCVVYPAGHYITNYLPNINTSLIRHQLHIGTILAWIKPSMPITKDTCSILFSIVWYHPYWHLESTVRKLFKEQEPYSNSSITFLIFNMNYCTSLFLCKSMQRYLSNKWLEASVKLLQCDMKWFYAITPFSSQKC
jgi:hypothetical protein